MKGEALSQKQEENIESHAVNPVFEKYERHLDTIDRLEAMLKNDELLTRSTRDRLFFLGPKLGPSTRWLPVGEGYEIKITPGGEKLQYRPDNFSRYLEELHPKISVYGRKVDEAGKPLPDSRELIAEVYKERQSISKRARIKKPTGKYRNFKVSTGYGMFSEVSHRSEEVVNYDVARAMDETELEAFNSLLDMAGQTASE